MFPNDLPAIRKDFPGFCHLESISGMPESRSVSRSFEEEHYVLLKRGASYLKIEFFHETSGRRGEKTRDQGQPKSLLPRVRFNRCL